MQIQNLLYSKNENHYFWIKQNNICVRCKEPIEDFIIIHRYAIINKIYEETYCKFCKEEISHKETETIKEAYIVSSLKNTPLDSVPVNPRHDFDKTSIGNRNQTNVFEASAPSKDGEYIDASKLIASKDPNFTIQSDVKNPLQIAADIEEQDRTLGARQATEVLKDLSDAQLFNSRFELEEQEDREKERLKKIEEEKERQIYWQKHLAWKAKRDEERKRLGGG
jgi:hypothetical protein